MIGLFFLAVREGFVMDLVVPGIAAIFVFALIGNSLLNHFGWTLVSE